MTSSPDPKGATDEVAPLKIAVYLTAAEADLTRRAVDHYRHALEMVGVEIATYDETSHFDDRPLIRRAIDLSLRFANAFSTALNAKARS